MAIVGGRDSRRAEKAAVRRDLDGSGPTVNDRPAVANPGATSRFGLFGEVLLIGLLMTLVSIPIVTLPAALAAGVRHLRRFAAAEDSNIGLFWADVRRGVLGGAVVGLATAVLALVLVLDIDLARSGALPGPDVFGIAAIEIVGWVGLAVLGAALLLLAGTWDPEDGWLAAVRSIPSAVRADPFSAVYFAATVGFVGVATWALVPLFIPALGCAALAVVAVPTRRRRVHADASEEIDQ